MIGQNFRPLIFLQLVVASHFEGSFVFSHSHLVGVILAYFGRHFSHGSSHFLGHEMTSAFFCTDTWLTRRWRPYRISIAQYSRPQHQPKALQVGKFKRENDAKTWTLGVPHFCFSLPKLLKHVLHVFFPFPHRCPLLQAALMDQIIDNLCWIICRYLNVYYLLMWWGVPPLLRRIADLA